MRTVARLARFAALASLVIAAGAVHAAGPRFAYVSNAADGSVSVLDLRDDRVIGTVKTGPMGAHGIAASPDGRYGFAALESANEVVVIDGELQAVVARIAVPFSGAMAIHGLDISPDGRFLWVGARQGGDRRSEVVSAELAVINTATRAVEKVLQTGLGVPSHYAMTPDGKELWIASTTVDLIWIVDTASREVTGAIPLVPPARSEEQRAVVAGTGIIALNEVAISPDGQRAYAVGPVADVVFAIDVPTRKVIGTVKSNRNAHGIAVSRDGTEVWTSDWGGTLTVIDAASLRIKDTVQLGGKPNHIGFSADGSKLYVTRTGEDPEAGEVLVLDSRTRKTLRTLRVGKGPHEISLEDLVVATSAPAGTSASGAGPSPSASAKVKDSGAGGVTGEASLASAEFLASKGEPADRWGFLVSLDTHAVDLTAVDVVGSAFLRHADGRVFKPVAWRPLSEDSHHRSGLLLFPAGAAGLAATAPQKLNGMQLVFSGLAGVAERVLVWK
jgi:DNA-binding beta-propeller fold protein YncE